MMNRKETLAFVERHWPALIKLASRLRKERLAKVWDEHTRRGAHQSRQERFPKQGTI
jgi:hypothetical protein